MPELTVHLTAARRRLSLSGAFRGTRLEIIQKTVLPNLLTHAHFHSHFLLAKIHWYYLWFFANTARCSPLFHPNPIPIEQTLGASRISIYCFSDFGFFFGNISRTDRICMIYGQEPHLPDIQIDTTAHFKHNPKSENALEEKEIHWNLGY